MDPKQITLQFAELFVTIFSILLVARIILSYVVSPGNRLYQGLVSITEPLLEPVRRLVPQFAPGLDLSPIVTYLLLQGALALLHYLLGL